MPRASGKVLSLAIAILFLCPMLGVSPVAAQEGLKVYEEHADAIVRKIDGALQAYDSGDINGAYSLASSTYLDHFEFLEPYIRPQFPDQVLAWEETFFEFRESIRQSAPTEEVHRIARELKDEISWDVRGKFEGTSEAVQGAAAVLSASIVFREGVEAVLLIGIFTAYLQSLGRLHLRKNILFGVILAIVGSVATWFMISYVFYVSRIAGVAGALTEAVASLLAVGTLFYVSFWILRRFDERRVIEFIKSSAWRAIRQNEGFMVAVLTFLAVYREGFETVLFYQAMINIYPAEILPWISVGFLSGLIATIALGMLVYAFGVRVPIKWIFLFTMFVAASLSIFFIGSAIKEIQILGIIPYTPLDWLPPGDALLASLTGYRRTFETILAQGSLATVYIIGAFYGWRRFGGR